MIWFELCIDHELYDIASAKKIQVLKTHHWDFPSGESGWGFKGSVAHGV